jgi:hypothetical protein
MTLAHDLNQLFRRFRHYEKEADWVRLVMEGAGAYAREVALFVVSGDALQLRGSQNLELPETLRLDAKQAAAFEAVLHSKEAVTALRTIGEVGAALASPAKLAHLFPILNGSRVAAILFAAAENSELDPLELVANMASSVLERNANKGQHSQIAAAPPLEQRALHSQAARYARVAVAEMQLLKPAACRAAREKGGLYMLLGKEIDKARETYQKQFMTIPSMADYFHKELVSSILGGDATKLGADYPGELS